MDEPPRDSDDPQEGVTPPTDTDGDPTQSRMGMAPRVFGGDRMRAQIAAQLFGGLPEPDAKQDEEDEKLTDGDADTLVALDTPAPKAVDLEESILKDRLGRFRVLERLGRGGMGVVYSAYDPQLDRKVALKLLRPDVHEGLGAEAAKARLLREAQAMAKINHPHVIVVHEVGTLDDRVFVAMEFVDGGTMSSWMRRRPPWREVIEVFVRAGSGLAAAHSEGLVHRDFKPDNVLMGTDGRVRVVDFGLARPAESTVEEEEPRRSRQEQPDHDSLNTPLTRTGAVMGTPAYMSPEQHLGQPADARSDQYSFCVALWEALHGQRPFGGTSLAELTTNVLDGVPRDPPPNVHVPRWIATALRRGLSRNPDHRFPTMEHLLTELRRDPMRKWKLGALGALGVGAAAFVGIGAYQRVLTGECDELADAMHETWNDGRRDALVETIVAVGAPWSEYVAASTTAHLDAYADDWQKRAANQCLASQVGTEEARSLWPNRRLCFEDRRAGLDQLVTQLEEGGEDLSKMALQAVVSLPDLAACEDPQRLGVFDELSDPKAQERLAHARRRLVKASTAGSLGEPQKAVEVATAVIEDARELGVASLEAEGLVVRGLNRLRVEQNDPKILEDLRLAVERAKEAGDSATRAKALIQLGLAVGADRTHYQEAMDIGERAAEAIESLGEAPLLEARLGAMLGIAARYAGDWDAAAEYFTKSLETLRALVGESHPDTLRALNGLGISLCRAKHFEEGLEILRSAVGSYEQVLGSDHPDLFTVRQSLGNCLARGEKYEEALGVLTQALANYRLDPNSDETRILTLEYNIAWVQLLSGQPEKSLVGAKAGIPRARKLLAARPKRLTDWHVLLGRSLEESKRYEEAVSAYEDALAVAREAKESRLFIIACQLKVARATGQFDPARGLILAEQLDKEISRLDNPDDASGERKELDKLLDKLRERKPPEPESPEPESPAPE